MALANIDKGVTEFPSIKGVTEFPSIKVGTYWRSSLGERLKVTRVTKNYVYYIAYRQDRRWEMVTNLRRFYEFYKKCSPPEPGGRNIKFDSSFKVKVKLSPNVQVRILTTELVSGTYRHYINKNRSA